MSLFGTQGLFAGVTTPREITKEIALAEAKPTRLFGMQIVTGGTATGYFAMFDADAGNGPDATGPVGHGATRDEAIGALRFAYLEDLESRHPMKFQTHLEDWYAGNEDAAGLHLDDDADLLTELFFADERAV